MKKRSKEQELIYNSTWKDLVKDGVVTTTGWKYLMSLASVVVCRYYLKRQGTHDLIMLAVIDCIEFLPKLEKNTIDGSYPEPKSIRNILFTRMRNAISNHLYRMRFELQTDIVRFSDVEDIADPKFDFLK